MPNAVHWTPEQLALLKTCSKPGKQKPAPERSTHIAVADMLRLDAKPGLLWTHHPAGEYRTPATAALLKRLGVMPGWPDLVFIDTDGQLAFMELKRRGGKLSQEQAAFRDACMERGIRYATCWSFAEADAQLRKWGFLAGRARVIA